MQGQSPPSFPSIPVLFSFLQPQLDPLFSLTFTLRNPIRVNSTPALRKRLYSIYVLITPLFYSITTTTFTTPLHLGAFESCIFRTIIQINVFNSRVDPVLSENIILYKFYSLGVRIYNNFNNIYSPSSLTDIWALS